MEYNVTGIVPLHPIIVQYTEDGEEREDMFFLSPENGALIPAFGPDEGPKEPKEFGPAFQEGWKTFVNSKRSNILRPNIMAPGAPGAPGGPGIVVP